MNGTCFGLVSVIMAAYNAEKTIQQAICSVMAQTYQNLEIVVVDDGSADNTVKIVEKLKKQDKRINLIRNNRNRGISYTRRHALEKARGDWVAILDSDDMWTEDKLEKQIQLQKFKSAEFLFTGSSFMDENGNLLKWRFHVPKEISYRKLLKQNVISNSSVLIKKKLYKEFFASGDRMHEDFAVWLRITRAGYKAYGIDEPLLIYRLAKNSKTGNKLHAARMNWNTYRYIGLDIFETVYYMAWYIINSLLKYRNLI